jgi:hypothetical protein
MGRGAAIAMGKACAREILMTSSSLQGSFELVALMDLRLAFGPGTRLWSLRSREELCYDWLHFKANHLNASFREFALRLYAHEKANALESMSMRQVRRRIAIVLRAYGIRKRVRPVPQLPLQTRAQSAQVTALNGKHRLSGPGTEILITAIPFDNPNHIPASHDKLPH